MDVAKVAEFLEMTVKDYRAISHAIRTIKSGVALAPDENDKVENLLGRLDETASVIDEFFNPKPVEETEADAVTGV